jgi:hypothetical protein
MFRGQILSCSSFFCGSTMIFMGQSPVIATSLPGRAPGLPHPPGLGADAICRSQRQEAILPRATHEIKMIFETEERQP